MPRESCGLDRVWFVVAGEPPHKRGDRTAVAHRLEMARIAVGRAPGVRGLGDRGNPAGPALQRETLESVHRERPDDELFFLIGADSLNDLPDWREPGRIAQLATIVVVNRPGIEEADPASFPTSAPARTRSQSVTIPPIGIASTDLRRRVGEGRSIRYMVPRGVEAYIEAQGLYRDAQQRGRQA